MSITYSVIAVSIMIIVIVVVLLIRKSMWKNKLEHYADQGKTSFVHPTTVNTKKELEGMSKLLEDTSLPAVKKQAIIDLRDKFAIPDLAVKPKAVPEIRVGYNPAPHDLEKMSKADQEKWKARSAQEKLDIEKGIVGGHEHFTGDGERCYKHAITYCLTKDKKFADKVVEILDAWATTCKKFGLINENGPLECGWGLCSMSMAAEIVYSMVPNETSKTRFINFVKSVLLPQFKAAQNPDGLWKANNFISKGNWGSTILQAQLQFAIFSNDVALFETSVKNAKTIIENLLISETGQEVETLRDIVHAQFGLAGLTGICELLWHHNIDIYSSMNNRLAKSYEYHASILLGEVPEDIKGQKLNWVGFNPANWEIVYNHFVNRKAMQMPKSKAILEKKRPESFGFHWGLGTITHFTAPKNSPAAPVVKAPETKQAMPVAVPKAPEIVSKVPQAAADHSNVQYKCSCEAI